jgi:hypothetical protein
MQDPPMPLSASVAVVIIVAVSIATTRLDDAARKQPTSEHQRDHCDEFDTHGFLSSVAMLVAIRRLISGSPPIFDDAPPNADAAPSVDALARAHAPPDDVPSSADRTYRHPNRLGEQRETVRQVGLTGGEPRLEPRFRLPENQELKSQPRNFAFAFTSSE